MALHDGVGVLARDALLGQCDEDALRVDEPAQPVEVPRHVLRIDDELVDQARHPLQDEVERYRRIRPDHALDGGVGDVAFVPERHILHGGEAVAAHHAGEPGDVLRAHGIALVRHGGGALLAD